MTAYHRPTELGHALALLSDADVRVLAGGTDLYPVADARLAGNVVDVSQIPELRQIVRLSDSISIGAAVTWAEIARATLPPALGALQAAALQVGGRQIQNAGTIGGNLCNASPAADGVPPLLVADAEVEVAGPAGLRRLALQDFISAPRRVTLAKGEVLVAIVLPAGGLTGNSAFEKLGARRHLVISIAMVAARVTVQAGRFSQVAVAVGSCSAVARRLPEVEAALLGQPVASVARSVQQNDVAANLAPIDDIRATAGYRIDAATVLVRRALLAAAEGAA